MVFPRSTTGYLSQSTRSQRFSPLPDILALEWGPGRYAKRGRHSNAAGRHKGVCSAVGGIQADRGRNCARSNLAEIFLDDLAYFIITVGSDYTCRCIAG